MTGPTLILLALLAATTLVACSGGQARPTPAATAPSTPWSVTSLSDEARAIAPSLRHEWVKQFVAGAGSLPRIAPRTLFSTAEGKWLTEAEAAGVGGLTSKVFDEEYYYTTRYGTPIAYARALDLLAGAGLDGIEGKRVLDFGFGGIGQLRLMAALGADAVGIEVDPIAPKLYSWPGDTGRVGKGSVSVIGGRWPADEAVAAAAGNGFSLFLAKNVLKNGYLHPERPVEEKRRIRLAIPDDEFVRRVAAALVPGGLFAIYNLCPAKAPADKPYIPWADGRSPFTRGQLQAAGFEVIAFDQDDTSAARAMARALSWDKGPDAMDVDGDLFALYTFARKR